jgi:hypothetical protein
MRLLEKLPLFVLASVLSALPACGHSTTRCAPVTPVVADECSDVSMAPEEGDTVDVWFKEGEAIPQKSDRCCYWTNRFSEVSAKMDGLTKFVDRMRESECTPAKGR